MRRNPVSLVAWGHPRNPHTFSGAALHVANALHRANLLRSEYDAKILRPSDILRGAYSLARLRSMLTAPSKFKWPSRRWIWSRAGSKILSKRLSQRIRRAGDRGPFLQIGTLVRIDEDLGPHFMYTDMTIAQARRAQRFKISELSDDALDEAEAIQRKRIDEAEHIFCLSQWCADSLIEDCGAAPDKVTVVYAGSNLNLPAGVQQERSEHEILFVGIDWERKGGSLLLEAFRHVREAIPDAVLTIVGSTPKTDQPGVNVEGFLSKRAPESHHRLAKCYLRATCFCLPTLFDPFPFAILEAASVGLASVAIDNGSRREAVVDGETGLLIRDADPAQLAEALIWMLSNPDQAYAMGAAARARVTTRFTWDAVVERIFAAAQ